jgi:hypothetical protein
MFVSSCLFSFYSFKAAGQTDLTVPAFCSPIFVLHFKKTKNLIMKKIFHSLSVLLVGATLFTACKKTETLTPVQPAAEAESLMAKGQPGSSVTRIKTKTQSGLLKTYSYDAQWRASEITGPVPIHFEYPDATHINELNWNDSTYYTLNNKGLVATVSTKMYNKTCTYNSKNQLINESSVYNGGSVITMDHIYLGGNLDHTNYYLDGTLTYIFSYTYYSKANVLDNDVFGQSFKGAGSKNMVKTMRFSIASNPDSYYTNTYEYVFDALGRVIKVMENEAGTQQPDIIYTYY